MRTEVGKGLDRGFATALRRQVRKGLLGRQQPRRSRLLLLESVEQSLEEGMEQVLGGVGRQLGEGAQAPFRRVQPVEHQNPRRQLDDGNHLHRLLTAGIRRRGSLTRARELETLVRQVVGDGVIGNGVTIDSQPPFERRKGPRYQSLQAEIGELQGCREGSVVRREAACGDEQQKPAGQDAHGGILPALVAAVLLAVPALADTQTEGRPTFLDAVQVVESELLVEVPRGAKLDEVEIVEADLIWGIDRKRPVVSRGSEAEWHVLIYVDAPLASPTRIAAAAKSLAGRAAALTERGEVEIVIADPAPQRFLAPTRSASRLEAALLELAAAAPGRGLERQRFDALARVKALEREVRFPAAQDAVGAEIATVRQQTDWLLLELERGCGGAACALVWINDGWPLTPGALWQSVLAKDVPAPAGDLGRPTAEVAQLAAAWRWVVWPVSIEPPRVTSPDSGRRSSFDRWVDTVTAYTGNVGDVVLWRVVGSRPDPTRPPPREQDLEGLLSLDAAPLRAIAAATAGTVFSSERMLETLPDRLDNFWRVWFRPTRELDGILREVRLKRRGVHVQDVLAPRWSRSGTPAVFAEVLVRRALEGDDGGGNLQLTATRGEQPGVLVLEADLGAIEPIELEVAPPRWRLSWAESDGAIHHRLMPDDPTGTLRHELAVGSGPVAIVVEDLVRRRRGVLLVR